MVPPDQARELLFSQLRFPAVEAESVETGAALGRVTATEIVAPHPLPEFPRSTVDGYALRAKDTFGASESLPAYLSLTGEIRMGAAPDFNVVAGQCVLIHTGGMLPVGADAVVMLEHIERVRGDVSTADLDKGPGKGAGQRAATAESGDISTEIEISKSLAEGENVIRVGEDIAEGQAAIRRGVRLKPADIGGLMALGIRSLRVARAVRIGLISSGDEVIPPKSKPARGQVRDVNAYSLAALVKKCGGDPVLCGIVPDDPIRLRELAVKALGECDAIVITAGSSAGARDSTAEVINSLGPPGVLVHGVNTRPGKPTILGVCSGKAAIGLPGNPVSALVNGYVFLKPLVETLIGLPPDSPQPSCIARLAVNLPSQAGREDWWPVKLRRPAHGDAQPRVGQDEGCTQWIAEPIFGRSNLIFTLAAADGLLRIPPQVTGLSAGEPVEVFLL